MLMRMNMVPRTMFMIPLVVMEKIVRMKVRMRF